MKDSNTNTAARELLEDVLGNLLGEEAIVWVETTTDGKYAEKMHALCNKARESIATLTQQQGGDQEGPTWNFRGPNGRTMEQALAVLLDQASRVEAFGLNGTAANLREAHEDIAALRTKQPAASEGDGPVVDKRLRVDRDWSEYPIGTKAHAVMGGYWIRVQHGWKWFNGSTFPTPGGDACGACIELPKPTAANTSKQAAGEAVEPLGYLHPIDFSAAQDNTETNGYVCRIFPNPGEIGVPLYTTPPRHPADEGREYPVPRNRTEAVALAKIALAHLGVIDAHIDAAIARCETNALQAGTP